MEERQAVTPDSVRPVRYIHRVYDILHAAQKGANSSEGVADVEITP
jgi:hypothetical protein